MKKFYLKHGLNIPISGEPNQVIHENKLPKSVALLGTDYNGIKPRMLVNIGDKVKRGTPLFIHKDNPDAKFVSPCTGIVKEINRGEKRKLLSVVVEIDDINDKGVNFIGKNKRTDKSISFVKKILLESGFWTSFLTRPYSKVPHSNTNPSSIFINAMDTEPLSPDPDIIINDDIEAFNEGIKIISKLSDGKIFVCTKLNSRVNGLDFETFEFDGPHPAGLTGTHMHFLDPPSSEKTVWSINYQDVIGIGKLFLTGYLDIKKIVSIGGPLSKKPRLISTVVGASLNDILRGEIVDEYKCRVISGSILSGFKAMNELSYIGKYSRQITLIKEDEDKHLFGWIAPQPKKYSVMPVLLSALGLTKSFNLTSNLNGGRRAMVPTGVFESLMPQDFLPTQILRSLLVMDTDVAQTLGVLELDEEDLALCTFACPAKYEYGIALRDNLEKIEKEG